MEKWDELIVEHSNVVKVAARKYLVGAYADWIDDAVQEVLLKAIIKRENYKYRTLNLQNGISLVIAYSPLIDVD